MTNNAMGQLLDAAAHAGAAGVRVVAGVVGADGAVRNGAGYAVAHVSTGHYLVSFQPPFQALDGVSVTQIYPGDGSTCDNAVIIRLDAGEVLLKTGDGGGNQSDRDFSFVAIGQGGALA
ncbi:hypothetical protein [Xanthomonas sacchari]|uniref:hypothetical protein n=1 Tax=Xanthomonas sacchari TaxID=56458 RepID=UPI0022597931|nr:hypothetical protein [Xanthomonas sacchari]MCW0453767.1 hypothetical protein [Xanthomonas sacchari]